MAIQGQLHGHSEWQPLSLDDPKERRKPLRVFFQTGTHDLDVVYGNWVIANQDMASALAYKGYDYRLVLGEGGSLAGARRGDLPRHDALAMARLSAPLPPDAPAQSSCYELERRCAAVMREAAPANCGTMCFFRERMPASRSA
jgi:hypothetical protein